MATRDRRPLVQASRVLNGIDFVEVANDAQTALRVHFLNGVSLAHTLDSPAVTITGGESIPTVPVNPIDDSTDWSHDGDHLVLNLTVAAPGDFSNYTLTIHQKTPLASGRPSLDPFFSRSEFSFKAACPSDLDCQTAPVVCPVPPSDAPPINYLAKDFLSFRQALLDVSALRYPEWQERSEADFGVMFLEALCALADDLSYTQDRVAAEAFLQTAMQRRSLVRQARLVDYWPSPALASSVLLQFDVQPGVTSVPDGLVVTAMGPEGTPIPFETGGSLRNRLVDSARNVVRTSPPTSTVSSAWNREAICPYWFDDSQRCLRAGATQMYVLGSGFKFFKGQSLLIETAPTTSADPPISQIVELLDEGTEQCDPLYPPPPNLPYTPPVLHCPGAPQGTAVTLIRWADADALKADRDLCHTILAGNLLWATQGLTQRSENFAIPSSPQQSLDIPPAIVRTGPNDTPSNPSLQYLYTLRFGPLAWLPPTDPTQFPQPEIVLTSKQAPGADSLLPRRSDPRLMSWGDGSGVPAAGNNLVIIGTDSTGLLRIRAFDASGAVVTDTDETKLASTQAGAISALKQRIPSLLPLHALTGAEKAKVLAEITSLVGQTVWQFQRWLLDAQPDDSAFTVDAARFSRIAGTVGDSLRFEYDGDAGDTLRFGDGVFGALPEPATTFSATYRVGGGASGNVAADSITSVTPNDPNAARVLRVTNPLPAAGGADPEPLASIRRKAPQAFRAVPYRAVLPADYQAAAQTLPWVLRAGSVFRWTGSWLTVLTTPDPVQNEQVTLDQRLQMIKLLNKYRIAGYESYVTEPAYVSIDLVVAVRAQLDAFQGAVEQAVMTALGSGSGGFFFHDNFTFGQPLDKSTLETVVQSNSGVAGVESVQFRFSGRMTDFDMMPDTVTVGSNQILRCDNDPSLPGNGSLRVIVMGGK